MQLSPLGQLPHQQQAHRPVLQLDLEKPLPVLGGGAELLGHPAVLDAEAHASVRPQHQGVIGAVPALHIGGQLFPGSLRQSRVAQPLRRLGEHLQVGLGVQDVLLQVFADGLGGQEHLFLLLVDDAVSILQPGGHAQIQQSGQKYSQHHGGAQHHRTLFPMALGFLSHGGFLSPGN